MAEKWIFWKSGRWKGRVDSERYSPWKRAGGAAELNVRQKPPRSHQLLKVGAISDQRRTLRIKVKPAVRGDTVSITLHIKLQWMAESFGWLPLWGGIGFRATEVWGDDTSTITYLRGRWFGKTCGWTESKMALLSKEIRKLEEKRDSLGHNTNKVHPEPLRSGQVGQYEGKRKMYLLSFALFVMNLGPLLKDGEIHLKISKW